jgi:CHAD domain-containing protein
MRTSKQLFKINSQVRDYDIICEKLQKYTSEPIYTKLTGSLNRKRKTKSASARKIALSLRDLAIPHVKESAIPTKKLEMRYNKVVVRLRERIELNLPIVLTNANKLKELHEMRKDSKKLRYLLELTSHQNKEIHTIITELEDIQDTLGTIHDCDTMIAYMKRIRHRNGLTSVDRILFPAMFYPCNYGFIPHTKEEQPGSNGEADPIVCTWAICRPINKYSVDSKIIAVH